MPDAKWARGIIFSAAAIWFVIVWFLGIPVDRAWMKYVGVAASVVVWTLLAFDKWLWRWLPQAVVKRPVLRGTWRAVLQSGWEPPEGASTHECYIVVHQTYSTICIEMMFANSDSTSTSAEITQGNGRPQLWYTYHSHAHALAQKGNPPHRGAARLYISSPPKPSLEGDYWTERQSKGRIVTAGYSKKVAESFSKAEELEFS